MSQSFRTIGSASVDSSIASGMTDFCKALYDYDATGSDEISFEEGDIIRVLKREPNGVDDGWWMGELRTGPRAGTSGLFPSIVVEECYDNGEDSQDDYSLASPQSSVAPPSFSPPRVPSVLSGHPDKPADEPFKYEQPPPKPPQPPLPPPPQPQPQLPPPPLPPQEDPIADDSQQSSEPSPDALPPKPVAPPAVPSLHFDLVADAPHSSDEEANSPEVEATTLGMEIVVTAPTPMVQSPVSEEEDDFQIEEKGDDEEMEKSVPDMKAEEVESVNINGPDKTDSKVQEVSLHLYFLL